MPGLIRDLDPEATARRLARSASSPTPPASKQPPPRAPPSAQGQPKTDEDPWEQAGANRAVPSPCAAPPPRALAQPTPTSSALHGVTGEAPLPPPTTYGPVAPRSDRRRLPHETLYDEGAVKASENLVVPLPCPAPPSRPTLGIVPPRYTTPSPTYYFAPPFFYASRASALFPRPYVPASAAVLASAMQPQPQQQTRSAALARTQRPIAYAQEGVQVATDPNNKKREGQLRSDNVEKSSSSSVLEVAALLGQTQQPIPHPVEGFQAPTGLKKKGEDHLHKSKERPLRIREESGANLGQALKGCVMSNLTSQYILDSIATFGTNGQKEMDIIRNVFMILPEGQRSALHHEQCSRGDTRNDGAESAMPSRILCFDTAPELMMFGSIRSEHWNRIWEQIPLVLHDADLVRATKAIEAPVNFLQRISDILHKHPGPIKYFRIDSCKLGNGIDQLQEWFELLRRKQVKEVVFVNCMWPSDIFDFPINNLDCESLKRISLCFVKLSDICLHYVGNLTTINLSCCSISTQDLYALSYQCKHLKELKIGVYEGEVIRINSGSLEIFIIWKCTVRKVAVQNGAKLRRILVAALPRKQTLQVGVWIEDAQALTDASFNLSVQSVSIRSTKTNMDNGPLLNLRRLALHFTFKEEKEKDVLMNLMKRCTQLRELILWRNDEPYRFECLDAKLDDWSAKFNSLSCLELLEVFKIKDYKGGDIELAISSSILEYASNLQQLILEADSVQNESIFVGATAHLEKVARASVAVKYKIGITND